MTITYYYLLLLFTFCKYSFSLYDQTDVAAGIKLSANEEMLVTASNTFANFVIIFDPFNETRTNSFDSCDSLRYNTTDRFVHSVAVVGRTNSTADPNSYTFVFTAEEMSTMTPYVCIVTISQLTCLATTQCTNVASAGSHQEYFPIGVDSYGNFAYGMTSTFLFKLHIVTNTMMTSLTNDAVWPSFNFIPHSLDMADSWAFVVGYGYSNIIHKDYAAFGCIIDLVSLVNVACIKLIEETTYLVPSEVSFYSALHEMSVAIRGEKILVGIHRLNAVILLHYNGILLTVTQSHTISYSGSVSFGRGVDWADDTTIAILLYESSQSSWSKSQIFFYNEDSVSSTTPLFTFPNNQQILGTRLLNPYFARFIITKQGNMGILTDRADILIVPIASSGLTSVWIDTTALVYVFYYKSKRCIGGTFKNISSLGPCQICPHGTHNTALQSDSGWTCRLCSDYLLNSFCPLASVMDLSKNNITSYIQAVAYPDSPDTTDIEDLLLENTFQIKSARGCVVLSPLFWTLMVGGLCFLIWLVMVLLKQLDCKQYANHRKQVKKIFQRTDIIGEGELWVGGLVTLTVIVLIAFSYWFLTAFVRRYPIENIIEPASFSCDRSLTNAKFSTGLEVVSLPKSVDAQPIFTLLDEQIFRLTVELINTDFMCDAITAQENLVNNKYILVSTQCTQSLSNATTSITVAFSSHVSTIQINMTGPYYIGGIRICIRGDGSNTSRSTLKALDFCQFYYTDEETIDRVTVVSMTFVKNINMTKPMNKGDSNVYSGLWIPAFSSVPSTDETYYKESGNYLRYTSSLTIIQVKIDERAFYIKNIQEPIIRESQAVFNAVLFTFLCIELFCLSIYPMQTLCCSSLQTDSATMEKVS